MFQIDIDAGRQFVSVAVMGLLDQAEAERYIASIQSEFVRKIGARPYVMMIDTTRCNLQSQNVVETFARHVASFPKATRIALVNGDSLARMQLRRVLTREYSRFFDTVQAARPWLLANWPPKSALPVRSVIDGYVRAAQASHSQPPISNAPPIGVTAPSQRGSPSAIR